MAEYEYLTVTREYNNYFKEYWYTIPGYSGLAADSNMSSWMRSLGKDGWELVSDSGSKMVFKRQKYSVDIDNLFADIEYDEESDFAVENGVLTKYTGAGGEVVIPDTVTQIGDSAFSFCGKVTSVTIPDSVTRIGMSAFYNCYKLSSIAVPGSVTEIDDKAFEACENLRDVSLPIGLRRIGDGAFLNCEKLSRIAIPGTVTELGGDAFHGCDALEQVTLPQGITEIKSDTFSGCKSLARVVIPDGVAEIGRMAFYNCKKLEGVAIPDCVEAIELMAFYGCKKLTVYASEGSYAAEYAAEEGIRFSDIKDLQVPAAEETPQQQASFESDCAKLVEILESIKNSGRLQDVQLLLRPYIEEATQPQPEPSPVVEEVFDIVDDDDLSDLLEVVDLD